MFGTEGIRIPIGASDEDAATAERLQFTAAEGPCLDAHALARSVLATETLIAQRWPDFHAGLLARTPFRAVAAIPWPATLKGAGTVDLLFRHSRDLADLDISQADEVIAQVEHTLNTESVLEFTLTGPGPAWLTGRRRIPGTRCSSRWACSMSRWTCQPRMRWPCSAGMPTRPTAPSTTSPMTSRTGGSRRRAAGGHQRVTRSRQTVRTHTTRGAFGLVAPSQGARQRLMSAIGLPGKPR